jgi:predicted lipase
MAEWTRRRLLLAALGITAVGSGLSEQRRRRTNRLRQAQLTESLLDDPAVVNRAVSEAIEGDREATAEVARILAELDLRPPGRPYDRAISRTLIQASRLATEQYLTGKFDLRFDGAVGGLPSWSDRFAGYTQVASIRGPETVNAEKRLEIHHDAVRDPLVAGTDRLKGLIRNLAGRTSVLRWSHPVYWGFVLSSPDHHLLVLRGTQRGHEWLQTVRANQVRSGEIAAFDFPGAIHDGFATIYARLSRPVLAAVRELDPARPLFIGGHSLGAPLATLAALDIARRVPAFQDKLRLYTYAAPRLGNPTFAEAFSRVVPDSYRIVNLADPVPTLPPTKTGGIVYVHLGQPRGFTSSSGDIGPNHFISAYRDAIEAGRERPLEEAGTLAASSRSRPR